MENIVFASPKSLGEREKVAGTCTVKLGIEFPSVVDGMDNQTEIAYTGWPDRLYVIDREGRIAFKSSPGPFGFKPDGVAETLKRLLPATNN